MLQRVFKKINQLQPMTIIGYQARRNIWLLLSRSSSSSSSSLKIGFTRRFDIVPITSFRSYPMRTSGSDDAYKLINADGLAIIDVKEFAFRYFDETLQAKQFVEYATTQRDCIRFLVMLCDCTHWRYSLRNIMDVGVVELAEDIVYEDRNVFGLHQREKMSPILDNRDRFDLKKKKKGGVAEMKAFAADYCGNNASKKGLILNDVKLLETECPFLAWYVENERISPENQHMYATKLALFRQWLESKSPRAIQIKYLQKVLIYALQIGYGDDLRDKVIQGGTSFMESLNTSSWDLFGRIFVQNDTNNIPSLFVHQYSFQKVIIWNDGNEYSGLDQTRIRHTSNNKFAIQMIEKYFTGGRNEALDEYQSISTGACALSKQILVPVTKLNNPTPGSLAYLAREGGYTVGDTMLYWIDKNKGVTNNLVVPNLSVYRRLILEYPLRSLHQTLSSNSMKRNRQHL